MSIAAGFKVIAEVQQQSRALPQRRQRPSGIFHQMMSDIARFFEAVDSGISGFSLIAIAAVGRVENVIDDLKRKTNAIAERTNAFQIRIRSSAQIGADPDARTDQRARLGPVNGFELLF